MNTLKHQLFAYLTVFNALACSLASWECPGFPCFIVNPYDPNNTTISRVETCGPIADDFDACMKVLIIHVLFCYLHTFNCTFAQLIQEGHPCHYPDLRVCEQTGCLQNSLSNCTSGCSMLLDSYKEECTLACKRWCG